MKKDQPTFIDLFSGCGGLSLGLMNAGWKGIFAIEQCPDAFKTLRYNLIDENSHNIGRGKFSWPDWLEIAPHEISEFLKTYRNELEKSCENIDLVAGGPPCQGFSFAGRRLVDDPRNELFKHHLKVVDILKPNLVLMENVQGINSDFEEKNDTEYPENKNGKKNYAKIIFETLEDHGYHVQQHVIRAMDFGVPQYRPRYFTLGIRKDLEQSIKYFDIKEELSFERKSFLERKGLSPYKPVTVSEAISDLTTNEKIIIECVDNESRPGFFEIKYEGPRTQYQILMREGMGDQPSNSLRLVNHRKETISKFKQIHKTCRKGYSISNEYKARYGLKKHSIVVLDPDKPSHTLTTLPDDLLHYSEPRIHTVREHARLQSFPDWFAFKGKYTTGGDRRKHECPRYTQVGNAVPPLLAEAIGDILIKTYYPALHTKYPALVNKSVTARGES